MTEVSRPFGPALAEAIGGAWDADNATVRKGRFRVRMTFTGRVVIFDTLTMREADLGRISEGVDTLAGRWASLIGQGV